MSYVPPPAPVGPVPSPAQLRWHRMERYCFFHFTVNTFTGREWGEGAESPSVFNPSALDCRQWLRTIKDAGFTGAILTAKHHDGFCLWPSKHTTHSVAASPYKNGKGDVVREFIDACREFNIQAGLYLSPWDRHEPAYGDSPRYNDYYVKQLEELLTGYGELFEVWFDGACGEGPNGRRQEYDWERFKGTVARLQPNAVVFGDGGPGVRWIGNESGFATASTSCRFNRVGVNPGTSRWRELTEGERDGSDWLPGECDVSIRPGWFYHAKEDGQVKSLDHLLDIYYGSVGQSCGLHLNLPPDQRGLVHENDAARLAEFGRYLDSTFGNDFAQGRPAVADHVRGNVPAYAGERAVDGNPDTYWATDDVYIDGNLEVDLGRDATFDVVMVQEAIQLGERVRMFCVEIIENGAWREVARGTLVGYKRLIRLPRPVTAAKARLRILNATAAPAISRFGLFLQPAPF